MVVITAPISVTLDQPILDIIMPVVGPNTREVTENGNCIFAASTAFPPKPPVSTGLCTRIGIV